MGSSWWLADAWNQNPMFAVSWVFWVIFSICLHELGHGVAAIRCGDDTPRLLGHMTWNPLVHMGTWSLIMFALFGFTWGQMPVNPLRFRGRYDDAFVAFAGPFVNLILFVLCAVASCLWIVYGRGLPDPFGANLGVFVTCGTMINVVGFIFNLVPVPPLDGSRILGNFVPAYANLWRTESGAIIGMVAFALLFMAGGSRIWHVANTVAVTVIQAGVKLLPGHP
ncbi:MAG: site-2 protease family protein [Planctomycetes bacterium]|nr:site-2 protease family protein [Planctomycetota bacterium]